MQHFRLLFLQFALLLPLGFADQSLSITSRFVQTKRFIPDLSWDSILVSYEVNLPQNAQIDSYHFELKSIPETLSPAGTYSVESFGQNLLNCTIQLDIKCRIDDLNPFYDPNISKLSFNLTISGHKMGTFYLSSLILSNLDETNASEISVPNQGSGYVSAVIDISKPFVSELKVDPSRPGFLYIETTGSDWRIFDMILAANNNSQSSPVAASLVRVDHSEAFSRILRVPMETVAQNPHVFVHLFTSQRESIKIKVFFYISEFPKQFSETIVDIVEGKKCNLYQIEMSNLARNPRTEISVTEREGEIESVALKDQNEQFIVSCKSNENGFVESESEGILAQWDGDNFYLNVPQSYAEDYRKNFFYLEVCGAEEEYYSSFLLGIWTGSLDYKRYHANTEVFVSLSKIKTSEIFWMSLEDIDLFRNCTFSVSLPFYSLQSFGVGLCDITKESLKECVGNDFEELKSYFTLKGYNTFNAKMFPFDLDISPLKDSKDPGLLVQNLVLGIYFNLNQNSNPVTISFEIVTGEGFSQSRPRDVSYFKVEKSQTIQVLIDPEYSEKNHIFLSIDLIVLNLQGDTKIKIYQITENARLSTLYEDTGLDLPAMSRVLTIEGRQISPGTIYLNVTGLTESQFYIRKSFQKETGFSKSIPLQLESKFSEALYYNQTRVFTIPIDNQTGSKSVAITVFFAQIEGAGEALMGVNRVPTALVNDGRLSSKEESSRMFFRDIKSSSTLYVVVQPIVYTAEAAIDDEIDLLYEVYAEINQQENVKTFPLTNQVTFRDYLKVGTTFHGVFTVPASKYIKKLMVVIECGLPLDSLWFFLDDPSQSYSLASGSNSISYDDFLAKKPQSVSEPVRFAVSISNKNQRDVAFSLLVTSANVEYLTIGLPIFFPIPDAQESTYLVFSSNFTDALTLQISNLGDDFDIKYLIKTTKIDFDRITPDQISFNSGSTKISNDYSLKIEAIHLQRCSQGCTILFKITNIGTGNHPYTEGRAIISHFSVTSMIVDKPYYVQELKPSSYDSYLLEITNAGNCRPRVVLMPFKGGEVDLYVNSGEYSNFPTVSHAQFASREIGGDYLDLEKGNMGPYEISVYNPGLESAGYSIQASCISENDLPLVEIETGKIESFPMKGKIASYFYFVSEESHLLIHFNTNMNAQCEVSLNSAILELSPEGLGVSGLIKSLIPTGSRSQYTQTFFSSDPLAQNWIDVEDETGGGLLSNDTICVFRISCNENGFVDIYAKSNGHFVQVYEGFEVYDRIDQPNSPNLYSIESSHNEDSRLTITLEHELPVNSQDNFSVQVNYNSQMNFPSASSSKFTAKELMAFPCILTLEIPGNRKKAESILVSISSGMVPVNYAMVLVSTSSEQTIHEGEEISFVLKANSNQTFMLASSPNQTTISNDLVVSYSFACSESKDIPSIAKCVPPKLEAYYIKQKSSTVSLSEKKPVEVVIYFAGDEGGLFRFKAESMSYYYLVFSNSPNSTLESSTPDLIKIDFSVSFFDSVNILDLPFYTSHPGIVPEDSSDLFAIHCKSKMVISVLFTVCSGGLDIASTTNLDDALSEIFSTRNIVFGESEINKQCLENQTIYLRVKYSRGHDEVIPNQAIYKIRAIEYSFGRQFIKTPDTTVQISHKIESKNTETLEVQVNKISYMQFTSPSCNLKSQHALMVAGNSLEAITFALKCPDLSNTFDQITSSRFEYKSENCGDDTCIVKKVLKEKFSLVGVRQEMDFDGKCNSESMSYVYPVMGMPGLEKGFSDFLGFNFLTAVVFGIGFLGVLGVLLVVKLYLSLRKAKKIIYNYEKANELTSNFPSNDSQITY